MAGHTGGSCTVMERIDITTSNPVSHKPASGFRLLVLLFVVTVSCAFSIASLAQNSASRHSVVPMGEWLNYIETRYTGNAVLLHLRTGYERAVLMPEPVRLKDGEAPLPGCDLAIDREIIGFYPTRTFGRTSIRFIGLNSGIEYQLLVRASPLGIRQPLEITR